MNVVYMCPNALAISVPITPNGGNTANSYIFPTQQELQDHKIVAIQAYSGLDIASDPLNDGSVAPPTAVFNAAFLTLYTSVKKIKPVPGVSQRKQNEQQAGLYLDKIPFCSLRNANNNDPTLTPLPSFSREIFMIRPTELAFNKCKVEFPTSVAVAANVSACFLFHYLDLGDDGSQWMQMYFPRVSGFEE